MTTTFLPRYADVIRSMSDADIENECLWPDKLLMVEGYNRRSPMKLVVAYAPFDHINEQAQVVIVGLTPGETQMRLALHEARRALKDGEDFSGVIRRAKKHASFGGDMRAPLIQLLDFIGVNRLVGRATSASLWDTGEDLAHFTSCLRYPTFRQAKKRNYGGSPMIRTTDVLRNELERWLVEEMRALSGAAWFVLGDPAADAAPLAARIAGLDPDRLIVGLPHPSGENRERIDYFLGRGRPEGPSDRTDAAKVDAARERILGQMARLIADVEARSCRVGAEG